MAGKSNKKKKKSKKQKDKGWQFPWSSADSTSSEDSGDLKRIITETGANNVVSEKFTKQESSEDFKIWTKYEDMISDIGSRYPNQVTQVFYKVWQIYLKEWIKADTPGKTPKIQKEKLIEFVKRALHPEFPANPRLVQTLKENNLNEGDIGIFLRDMHEAKLFEEENNIVGDELIDSILGGKREETGTERKGKLFDSASSSSGSSNTTIKESKTEQKVLIDIHHTMQGETVPKSESNGVSGLDWLAAGEGNEARRPPSAPPMPANVLQPERVTRYPAGEAAASTTTAGNHTGFPRQQNLYPQLHGVDEINILDGNEKDNFQKKYF